MNCWDYMDCPEEIRSKCPAYPANGRDCWKMLSTKCGGGRYELSSIVEKVAFCRNCEYYTMHVRKVMNLSKHSEGAFPDLRGGRHV